MVGRTSPNRRPVWPAVVVVIVLAVLAGAFLLVREWMAFSRPAPEFSSLADAPDPTLRGTVAYFAVTTDAAAGTESGCVRIVAAAGAPSKDVLCVVAGEYETGPQLAFLPDGRLEVTMFRWPTEQGLTAGWQKVVDVRSGEVEDVPAGLVPSAPTPAGPIVTPSGERIAGSSEGGTAEISVTDAGGATRVLMTAEVAPDYQIRAIWSPTWEWALAYDGRLLVVTAGESPQTRVLVGEAGGFGGYGSTDVPLALFAVSDADLLGS